MEIQVKGDTIHLDATDWKVLQGYKIGTRTIHGRKYAYFYQDRKQISLHRFLLGMNHKDARCVHFKDGNGLNLRRENMEVLDREQMQWVKRQSGDVGVRLSVFGGWSARIKWGKVEIHLGQFPTKDAAIAAYQQAKRERDS